MAWLDLRVGTNYTLFMVQVFCFEMEMERLAACAIAFEVWTGEQSFHNLSTIKRASEGK